MAQAVTTTFVCSESEDGVSPLFFSQAPSWHQAILFSSWAVTFPHKILAVISNVSSEGNIGILLWTS